MTKKIVKLKAADELPEFVDEVVVHEVEEVLEVVDDEAAALVVDVVEGEVVVAAEVVEVVGRTDEVLVVAGVVDVEEDWLLDEEVPPPKEVEYR